MSSLIQLWIGKQTFDVRFERGEAFTYLGGRRVSARTSFDLDKVLRFILKGGAA